MRIEIGLRGGPIGLDQRTTRTAIFGCGQIRSDKGTPKHMSGCWRSISEIPSWLASRPMAVSISLGQHISEMNGVRRADSFWVRRGRHTSAQGIVEALEMARTGIRSSLDAKSIL